LGCWHIGRHSAKPRRLTWSPTCRRTPALSTTQPRSLVAQAVLAMEEGTAHALVNVVKPMAVMFKLPAGRTSVARHHVWLLNG
jgi:hypothetical protein